jgi:hypothetical protein
VKLRCHIELYKPGPEPAESRLLVAVPATKTSLNRMLNSSRCRREGCEILMHCPLHKERPIWRHDGARWRPVR